MANSPKPTGRRPRVSQKRTAAVVPTAPTVEWGRLRTGLESSLSVAQMRGRIDDASIALARSLADKLDAWDVIVRWAVEDMHEAEGKRPAVPQFDNVTTSQYQKLLKDIGLIAMANSATDPNGDADDTSQAASFHAAFDPDSA